MGWPRKGLGPWTISFRVNTMLRRFLTLGSGAFLVTAALLHTWPGPLQAQEKGAPPTRWEYCELSWVGERLRLEKGDAVLEANNIPEMAEKLGHKTQLN